MHRKTTLAASIALGLIGTAVLAHGLPQRLWNLAFGRSAAPAAAIAVRTSAPAPSPMTVADGSAHAVSKDSEPLPLVNLSIELPRYNKNKDPGLPLIDAAGGTALVFKAALTREPDGYFAGAGLLVEPAPTACLEGSPLVLYSCLSQSGVLMEFRKDQDMVGAEDPIGRQEQRDALALDSASGRPIFRHFTLLSLGTYDWVEAGYGPDTGADGVMDGIGYGADDDLPGLVVLSPAGVGRVMNRDFSLPPTLTQRNLAGFMSSVGWLPRNSFGLPEVTATMLLPNGLLAPIVQMDFCVAGTCMENGYYRVDGGPLQSYVFPPFDPHSWGLDAIYQNIFANTRYELTAFIVKGVAPSTLADLDGDGRVGAEDARLAGYTLLSNEVRLPFRQTVMPGRACNNGTGRMHGLSADLDGDGQALPGCSMGGGAGMLSTIPR